MRTFLRTRGGALALVALGVLLLVAGTGVSYGHRLLTDGPEAATAPVARETRTDALAADAMVHVDVLGVKTSQGARVAPPAPKALDVPSVEAHRGVSLPVGAAPVDVGADLSLLSGAALQRAHPAAQPVQAQDARVEKVPLAAPAVLAAAALTGAGLLAWCWGSLKAWGQKLLVLPLVGLYARISRAAVFENDVREAIFQAIRAAPGISASDLAKKVGVSWGTTIYHLDVLEQNRMVTSLREGRHRRYFENGANLAASKQAVAILQNPVTAGVVETVKRAPGATQKELAGATGMSPQALHWHLARLVGAGLVRKERHGRVVRHFASA